MASWTAICFQPTGCAANARVVPHGGMPVMAQPGICALLLQRQGSKLLRPKRKSRLARSGLGLQNLDADASRLHPLGWAHRCRFCRHATSAAQIGVPTNPASAARRRLAAPPASVGLRQLIQRFLPARHICCADMSTVQPRKRCAPAPCGASCISWTAPTDPTFFASTSHLLRRYECRPTPQALRAGALRRLLHQLDCAN